MDGMTRCVRVLPVLALAVLILAGAVPSAAQEATYSRELYDNDEVFQQLSGALQSHLERLYGRKPRPDMPALNQREDKSIATGPIGQLPSLSMIEQVLVNDAAADATAQDTQSETAIVIGSGGRIIVGFNDSGSYLTPNPSFTGWSQSVDGGVSFADQGRLPYSTGSDFGDPVLARSASTGTIFLSTLASANVLKIFRSTDNGTSFLTAVNGTPGFTSGNHDKEWIAVDNFPGTGYGNVYMAWRNFGTPNAGIVLTRSTNDGVTWIPSQGTLIASPGSYNVQGPQVVVGTDHSVYVIWYDQSGGSSTFPTLRVRRSVDLGVTWGAPVTITTLHTRGVNGDCGLGFRTNAFPQAVVNPVSGHLYVAYGDSVGSGDRCSAYFTYSTNNGTTWIAPTALTGFNDQWMPSIAVRPDGTGLSVTWYDRQSDAGNSMIERWGRNAVISGSTIAWGAPFRISGPFPAVYGVDPIVVAAYMGDYDQMAADNDYYYTVWGDNRDQSIAVPSRKNANVRFARYPSDAYLEFVGSQVSGGNGNGIVDVNECNNLTVTLRNYGGSPITGIAATMTSLTEGVVIFNANQAFADAAVGGYTTNGSPFLVNTTRSLPCRGMIDLQINLTWSGGSKFINFQVPVGGYAFGAGTGFTQPVGTTNLNLNGDDLVKPINLPFPITLYNTTYTSAYVSTNGNMQFESSAGTFTNYCPGPQTALNTVIMPYFDDLITTSGGVFTAVTGSAPNRAFVVEWRATTLAGGLTANFSLRFQENSPGNVEMFYGTVADAGNSATVGMQYGTGYTSLYSCNTGSLSSTMRILAYPGGCVEGPGTCLPPDIALAPASLSFTVPQNGAASNVVTISNTAAAGSDLLDWSAGDHAGSLVLSSGQTLPVSLRREMASFADLKEEEAKVEPEKPVFPTEQEEARRLGSLPATETTFGTPPHAEGPMSATAAGIPYVETFESGNFQTWFNEGNTASAVVLYGDTPEGFYRLFVDSVQSHFSALRQNWSPGVQPSTIEFYVRPESPATNAQGYVVLTTGGAANTEVIWFYCDNRGKLYVNGDLASGDSSVAYTPNTWYHIEYRDINWTAKNFDYYVDGSLVKANISFRNAGSVSNIDRLHIYNFFASAKASWDGIRVGGQLPNAWLSEVPTGGRIAPGASSSLLVSASAAGLTPATYTGTLVVSSNDPDEQSLTIPVNLTVTPLATPTEFAAAVSASSLFIADLQRDAMYGPYIPGGLVSAIDVAVTPDRTRAVVTSFSPPKVYFVDIDPIFTPFVFDSVAIPGATNVEDIALTRDGRFAVLAGAGGNTYLTVVNVGTRAVVASLNISPRTAAAVEVGPDGTVLAAGFNQNALHVLRLNLATGALTDLATSFAVPSPINIAISPDGKTALVSGAWSGEVRAFSITGPGSLVAGSVLTGLRGPGAMQFRPDGQYAQVVQALPSPDSLAEIRVSAPGVAALTGARTALAGNSNAIYYGVDVIGFGEAGTELLSADAGGVLPGFSLVNLPSQRYSLVLPVAGSAGGIATAGTSSQGSNVATNVTVFDNCNSTVLRFGTASGATPGYEAVFDQYAPPEPPAGAFDARFRVSSPPNDFLKDFRALNTGTKIWRLLFRPQTACGNVTIAWALAQLPPTGSIRLRDAFGGILTDVDMRSASSYTVTNGLTELWIIYSVDAPFTKSVASNWNLLGLPNTVTLPYYLSVFPTATPGTLYEFNGTYVARDTLREGKGYWLRFGAPASQGIPGVFMNSTSNSLAAGWNMIAGPSCDVPRTAISDPGGIIIPGTLYGFSGTYVASDTVKRGNGYWVRTTAAGNIGLSCGSTLGPLGKTVAEAPDVTKYPSINVSDASGHEVTLYAGVKVKNPSEMLSFTMPPVPPAGSFDARFTGDLRAIEGSEGVVRLQAGSYPITVTASAGAEFVLEELIGTEAGPTHRLTGGGTVLIGDTKVTGFRVRSQSGEEIPASFVVDQNYPNPFNPSTEIRYGIPADATVRVVVYNALGQSVRTLVNEAQKAGYYRVTWQGDNDGGTKVGSGVYFYRVTAGDASSLKKMLLVK